MADLHEQIDKQMHEISEALTMLRDTLPAAFEHHADSDESEFIEINHNLDIALSQINTSLGRASDVLKPPR